MLSGTLLSSRKQEIIPEKMASCHFHPVPLVYPRAQVGQPCSVLRGDKEMSKWCHLTADVITHVHPVGNAFDPFPQIRVRPHDNIGTVLGGACGMVPWFQKTDGRLQFVWRKSIMTAVRFDPFMQVTF